MSPALRPARSLPRPWRLLVGLALVLLLLAGCSTGQDGSSAGEAAAPAHDGVGADAGSDSDASGGGGAEEDSDAGAEAPGLLTGSQGRRVVTAGLDLAVEDVPAAAARVREVALAADGEVQQERSTGGEAPRAEIVVRVPVEATDDLLGTLTRLGQERTRTTSTEPAEDRLVDLESRTATQRAGVERIRALLEQAGSLEDVLALEAELTRRQADLESVDAQRAALADRAALATVTVVLTEAEDVVAGPGEPRPPFVAGLVAGWRALVASTAVVLVSVGALLPFAAVAAAVLALVLLVRRARRRARPSAVGAAPTP